MYLNTSDKTKSNLDQNSSSHVSCGVIGFDWRRISSWLDKSYRRKIPPVNLARCRWKNPSRWGQLPEPEMRSEGLWDHRGKKSMWTPIPAVCRESKHVGPRTGTHWDGSKYSGVRTGISCTKSSRPTAPAWCLMCVNDLCRPRPLLFILREMAFRGVTRSYYPVLREPTEPKTTDIR